MCVSLCIYTISYKVKVYFYISCLNYSTYYIFISYSHKSGSGALWKSPRLLSWLDVVDLDTPRIHPRNQGAAPEHHSDPTLPFMEHRLPTKEHTLVKHKALGKFENWPLVIFKMIRIDQMYILHKIQGGSWMAVCDLGVMAFTFWSSTGTSSLALLPSLTSNVKKTPPGKAKGLRLQLALWTMIRHSIARSSRRNNFSPSLNFTSSLTVWEWQVP